MTELELDARPLRVLGWGTYDVRRHPRAGILLDGLRAAGCDVVEVNEPDGSSTAERIATVSSPLRAMRQLARLPRVWAGLARRSRRVGPVDAVLVGYLGHLDVLAARLTMPRRTIVLDHLIFAADTAKDRAVGGAPMRAALRLLDRLAIASATIVVLDTDEHHAMLPVRARSKGIVVPVGAADEWIAAADAAPAPPRSPRLSVVFYGLFTPLQGAATIATAARLLHERGAPVDITMIGSGQDLDAALDAAGDAPVRWIDWVAPEDLPSLVAQHDVCLGIFGTGPKALRVVPNKVYQGLAAACAVVTSDTAPQRRALGDAAVYVPAGDAARLAAALEDLAHEPDVLARLASRGRALAAERFTPAALGGSLADRIRSETRAT